MLLHDTIILAELLKRTHAGKDCSAPLIRQDCDLTRIAGHIRLIGSTAGLSLRWSLDGKARTLTIVSQKGKGKKRLILMHQRDGETIAHRVQ